MYSLTTRFHVPCALRMYSMASRAAPSPPPCSVTRCASAFTSRRALATAMAKPQWRITGRSMTSSDEGGLRRLKVRRFQNAFEAGQLVLNALVNVFEFQVAGTQGHRLGDALGDQPALQPTQPGQRERGAIMRVEALGLDHAVADQSETTLILMLGGMGLRGLLCSRGSGKNPDFAVGQHAVDIEQNELDLLRPGFGHGRDSSTGPGSGDRLRLFAEGEDFTKDSCYHRRNGTPGSFLPGVGSSSGAGVVRRALRHAHRAAGAGVAAHPGAAHDPDFRSHRVGQDPGRISGLH